MKKRKQWAISLVLAFAMLFQMVGAAFAAGPVELPEDVAAALEVVLADEAEVTDEGAVATEAEDGEPSETDVAADAEEGPEGLEAEADAKVEDGELPSEVTDEAELGEALDEGEYVAPGVWSDADPYFTDDVRPEIEFSSPFGAFSSPFAVFSDPFAAFGMPSAIAEVSYPTYAEVYEQIMALKGEFPEGMTWTNYEPYGSKGDWGDSYYFKGGVIKGARYGVGCAALVFEFQDRVFGYLPIRVIDDPKRTDFHVGDFVRVNSSHFVMITQIASSGVIVVEGNYNSSVHWGRAISWDVLEQIANFSVTRYPTWYTEEGNADEVVESGTEGNLKWTLTQGGVLKISGDGAMPDFADKRPSWESSGKPILSVEIEPGVTSVSNSAFFNQKDIIGVSLPDTVTAIDTNAFNGTNIVGIAIPGSCKTIGDDAFRNCASLASIDIGDGVETIGQRAFHSCTNLGYVDFPGSLKNLGAAAFTSCRSLTQVRFMPNKSGLVIGDGAFTQCWYLNFVSLPEGITQIPPGLFQSCQSIAYLYIPSTVKALDEVGKTSPFTQSMVGVIYFGGTQAEWNKLVSGVHASLRSTLTMLSYATVVVDQKDPFVSDENPVDDLLGCKDGAHLGPIGEDGVCQNCGEDTDGEEPVTPVDPPTEHEHQWSEDWSHNTTHHWHECLVGGYFGCENDQKSGYAEHEYGEWGVVIEATTEEPGLKQRICNQCGHYETEEIPRLSGGTTETEHKWSATWSHDDNYHWRVCENYNCAGVENGTENGYGVHEYGDWVIHQAATTTHAGEKYRDCTTCGFRETEVIPKLPEPVNPPVQHQHNWSRDWSSDETGHWHNCSTAGCPITEDRQKSEYDVHAFGELEVDTPATETEAGSGHKKCTTCGYSTTVVIPATGGSGEPVDPTPGKHEHIWAKAWTKDGDAHWHECSANDCPITSNDEKDGYGAHEYGDWVIDVEATAEEVGSKHKDCKVCVYRVTEEIPVTGGSGEPVEPVDPTPGEHKHDWAKDWVYDSTHHWHQCLSDDCPIFANSEKDGYAEHSYGAWIIDQAPTATRTGNRYRACTVCEYRQNESIPATGGTTTPSNPGGTTRPGGTTGTTNPGTITNPGTTTTKPDPNVTTNADGSVTTKNPDGSTSVKLPTAVVTAAEQHGEPVTLVVDAVRVTKNAATATPITVQSDKGGTVKVEIPVVAPSISTVAVLVNPDGSTSVIKTSVPSKDGVIATVPSGATVKIVDNAKSFADVTAGDWYSDAVAFASAHELFAGTSATDFSPNTPMTRSMLMVVLARFAGAETNGGATWYEKATEWAIANGVSDGTRPNDNITREQLVTMLWRYMGSPIVDDVLPNYVDADKISGYARDAMNWAVKNGLVNGFGDGRLGPQGQATRAQVAEIMKNLILNLTQ